MSSDSVQIKLKEEKLFRDKPLNIVYFDKKSALVAHWSRVGRALVIGCSSSSLELHYIGTGMNESVIVLRKIKASHKTTSRYIYYAH